MSTISWQDAKEKGLAGNSTCTCLPSALDCLYNKDFPLWFYCFYKKAYEDQCNFGIDRNRTLKVYQKMIQLITGSTRLNQIYFRFAKSKEETETVLDNARLGGFKIIISTERFHVVGLKALPNGKWIMVGNETPISEELTSRDVLNIYI